MSDRTIRETIQHLAGTHDNDPVYVYDAEVDSVDEDNRICSVTLIGGRANNSLSNVRLMSSIDDGILIIPTVGSTVTIIFSSFTEPLVIGWSGWDKMILKGGDQGGLVLSPNLITKLNNLENLVNDLISKFNSHTHNVTAVGSPTGPSLIQEDQTLTKTIQSDIENPNITQGL